MGIVLSVYSKIAFKEFILPSINNSDYKVTLRGDYFQIGEDLTLNLEVLSDQWFIKDGMGYSISQNNIPCNRSELHDSEIYAIHAASHDELSLIIKEVEGSFHAYRKFLLKNNTEITVGKDAANVICYDYLGMVSRSHAIIRLSSTGLSIENKSPNGVYINSQRIDGTAEVAFGSYINIIGLHLVYLGDLLAIDMQDGVVVDEQVLLPYEYNDETVMFSNENSNENPAEAIYHRAPRNYEKLTEDTIEIEAPPQRNAVKKQPLFMSIGPSLTMALPMILGCVLMIYASSKTGGQSSLYMYSGLIMSVSSAAVGVVWTILNMRYQQQLESEEEAYRFQEYSHYLTEKTESIKKIYTDTTRRLQETYPSAADCLNYDMQKGTLWNRNHTHEDFLQHRLGQGNHPFQYRLEIPKKRFSLIKDELADKPAAIKENYQTLYHVPIMLDLLEKRLIGVIGQTKTKAAEIAKLLSIQLAANNSYIDVKLGYIYDNASSADYGQYDFAKWFPHVWSEDHRMRYVASTPEDASEVFYELVKVFRTREENSDHSSEKSLPRPYYVIFISNPNILLGELFAKYALSQDEKYGLTVVLLAERMEELPNECEFIVENTKNFTGMYDIFQGKMERQKIEFDSFSVDALEKFSRNLSTLHVPDNEDGGEMPNAITFFEMIGVERIEEYPVADRWAKNRTYENIRGLLGQRAGGVDCYLDVHEKYHGPHGLVAGTTGSGKSETLQTYILSLAVNYSPDDIGFFIIDYKGGGMANLFEGLPHMIGSISNLSGNQVKRAMISIKSENRRRQRVFAEHGVNNINLYTKLYKNGEAHSPIPHLFIIIDEFAELKREEPEFMYELISVAQVGRSLGVHLILATQKPSGTVDDNIWSNSKFRICLRVQDQQDSKDMLHKSDAAYITQAGRGYLQVGTDEIYELFQSGFSGAVYDENMVSTTKDIAKLITISGKVDMTGNSVKLSQKLKAEEIWITKLCGILENIMKTQIQNINSQTDAQGRMNYLLQQIYQEIKKADIDYPKNNYNTTCLRDFVYLYITAVNMEQEISLARSIIQLAAIQHKHLPQEKEHTQLDVTKEYLALVAKQYGYIHNIQLWMPLLGETIYLKEFEEYNRQAYSQSGWQDYSQEWNLNIVIGKVDDPENQTQVPLCIDLSEQGHIAIVGNIVSGKSTMLQTMAYAFIQKFSPAYINIYAMDFSSKMMAAFENAPQVGGVMYETDLEKIGKFFNMLQTMIDERKRLFKGANYQQYIQRNGVLLPAIVLFVDNYASFREKTEERYESNMIQISKEGASLGIYLIVTGGGFGYTDISNRIAENIETVLCLALQDKYAYGAMLHNMQIEVLPENGVKGRGLAYYGSRILEYQTALTEEAENSYQRMEKIEMLCRLMQQSWTGKTAKRIPEIPKKPTWGILSQLNEYQEMLMIPGKVPIGYNMETAAVYGISLREIYCYLVMGSARTGKTNFMKLFAQIAIEKGARVAVIDPSNRVMRSVSKQKKAIYISAEQEIFNFFRDVLTPIFQARNKRKNEMLNEDYEENEIFDEMSKEVPCFIFISDMAAFVNMVYTSSLDMKGFMETLIAKGRYHNIYFIAEIASNKISSVRGYQMFESFSEYKTGIHFGGKVSENSLLSFEYLSYQEQAETQKQGIGTLSAMNNGNEVSRLVIPLARK